MEEMIVRECVARLLSQALDIDVETGAKARGGPEHHRHGNDRQDQAQELQKRQQPNIRPRLSPPLDVFL